MQEDDLNILRDYVRMKVTKQKLIEEAEHSEEYKQYLADLQQKRSFENLPHELKMEMRGSAYPPFLREGGLMGKPPTGGSMGGRNVWLEYVKQYRANYPGSTLKQISKAYHQRPKLKSSSIKQEIEELRGNGWEELDLH